MKIIKGIQKTPEKVVVYGPEGIGKSTFLSCFPEPLFIDTEGSTKHMNVSRLPNPQSWMELLEEINYVIQNPDCCKTLAIDTIDWAEQLCTENILEKYGKNGIEDFGYGTGYVYVKEEFGRFLKLLDNVIEAGINVALAAHAQIRKFEQPDELGAYDRYELKLGKKTSSQTAPLVKEWADMVLFANYKTISVAVDKDGKKHKAQGGKRVMYTTHHPCWDAKNRHELESELPFDYKYVANIFDNFEPQNQTPVKLNQTEQIEREIDAVIDKMPEQDEETKTNKQQVKKINVDGIPKELAKLMIENNVTKEMIQNVVHQKGYYPSGTPIENFDTEFIEGVLIGAWDDVYKVIVEYETLPWEEK